MAWKKLFKLNRDEVLGLDIGSSAVKIVQMRKDGADFVVTAGGITKITPGTGSSKNQRQADTVRAIHDCLQSSVVQTRLAVCSVCGPEVAIRRFGFPSLPAGEIEGAVLLEASQVCPFSVDDGAVDYQITPNGDDDNVNGVLVAATKKVIKTKRELAKKSSLDCVLMDVDGLALLNCFSAFASDGRRRDVSHGAFRPLSAGGTTAILNVGSSFANLAIVSENGLPFVRDMPYGGNNIIKQIADERDIQPEIVGQRLLGINNSGTSQSDMDDSLVMACQKLVAGVAKTLQCLSAVGLHWSMGL